MYKHILIYNNKNKATLTHNAIETIFDSKFKTYKINMFNMDNFKFIFVF